METLMKAWENIENIIYKIIVWVILIPKTLLKIVLWPRDIPQYIREKLENKNQSFDEYISPIVLLLLVALVPYIVWRYIPTPGVEITTYAPPIITPTPTSTATFTPTSTATFTPTLTAAVALGLAEIIDNGADVTFTPTSTATFTPTSTVAITPIPKGESKTDDTRDLDFTADVTFVSTVGETTPITGYIVTYWRVEKEDAFGGEYTYLVQGKLERHTDNESAKLNPAFVNKNSAFIQLDNHSIQDTYSASFTPGTYRVVFVASKFKADAQIETFESKVYVHVPKVKEEQIAVDLDAQSRPDSKAFSFKEVEAQLQDETTIFLALGLLVPPLLFAFVTQLIGEDSSGRKKLLNPLEKDVVTENSLRRIFYIQCYYFSPVAFVFWATRYASRFMTPDVFYHYEKANLIILLPVFLMLFWFVSVQTHAIMNERNIRLRWALTIVVICMFLLFGGASTILYGNQLAIQDDTRMFMIWLYPVLAIGLLAGYYNLASFWQVGTKSMKKQDLTTGNQDSRTSLVARDQIVGQNAEDSSAWQEGTKSTRNQDAANGRQEREESSTGKDQSNETGEQNAEELRGLDKVLSIGILLIIIVTASLVFLSSASPMTGSVIDQKQNNVPASLIVMATTVSSNVTHIAEQEAQIQAATKEAQNQAATKDAQDQTATKDAQIQIATKDAQTTATLVQVPINTQVTLMSVQPSSTPIPDPSIYKDVFMGNFINPDQWQYFVTSGDESAVNYGFPDGGGLNVQLDPNGGDDINSILINSEYSYKDVQIETKSNNIGDNPNAVSLICRESDAGWYEFVVEYSGQVGIYRYDENGYTPLHPVEPNGDISTIINKYRAVCNRVDLKFFVNDRLVASASDDKFTEGYIGLAVGSGNSQPVNVDFKYIDVSQPQP